MNFFKENELPFRAHMRISSLTTLCSAAASLVTMAGLVSLGVLTPEHSAITACVATVLMLVSRLFASGRSSIIVSCLFTGVTCGALATATVLDLTADHGFVRFAFDVVCIATLGYFIAVVVSAYKKSGGSECE